MSYVCLTDDDIALISCGGTDFIDNRGAPLQDERMTRVKYFGPLMELTGTDEEQLEIAFPITVAKLRVTLEHYHPALAGESFRIAVDAVMRDSDTTLSAAGEIACLPAFAGG